MGVSYGPTNTVVIKFWVKVHTELQKVLNCKCPLHSKHLLLGILPSNIPGQFSYFFICNHNRQNSSCIKMETGIPNIEDWINKLRDYATMVKLTNYLNQCSRGLYDQLEPFLELSRSSELDAAEIKIYFRIELCM